jgi:hypothetical protein
MRNPKGSFNFRGRNCNISENSELIEELKNNNIE